MAIHFKKSNALLLLTPKTGSTWIRQKIQEFGLDVEIVGDPAMRDHDQLCAFDRAQYSLVGAFVRDPIDWYQSYWAYRVERGWRPRYSLDHHCASPSFETFVRRAVSILPGAVGNIFESYIGPAEAPVDFIGRQEQLAADFGRFLQLIGEPVDQQLLQSGPRINETRTRPEYTEELKELITLSEWIVLERLGYLEKRSDPIALRTMQARYPADATDLRLLALWTESIHWEPDDEKRADGRPVASATRHARIHSNYALFAQHKRKDLEQADERYRAALSLDDRHPRTLCNYGLFKWEHHGDPQAGRRLMLKALYGRPMHPYTLGKLARLTERAFNDDALAELLYRQSLQANARQPDVVSDLAGLLQRQRRLSDQRAVYAAAVQAMPQRPELLAAYGRFLVGEAGAPQEALDLLRPAAELAGASRLVLLAYLFALQRSDAAAPEIKHWYDRVVASPKEAADPQLAALLSQS